MKSHKEKQMYNYENDKMKNYENCFIKQKSSSNETKINNS